MSFTFKPAKREGVHLIIGAVGGTGSGKTYSALELASGLAGGRPFAVIDTEARRALQYAEFRHPPGSNCPVCAEHPFHFDFEHCPFKPPFSPARYLEAVIAAEKAKYPVIVVDSASHEHAGEGGILDMHEAELDRIAGNDYRKREKVKFLAWVKPKTDHKRMTSRLLQLNAHLILCFRAEPKMKLIKVVKSGRQVTEPVDVGWQPVCAKGLEYEMAASFMLRSERPGEVSDRTPDEMNPTGHAIKAPAPLLPIFSGTYLLNRGHGERLAEWAKGAADLEPASKKSGPTPGAEKIAAFLGFMPKAKKASDEATRLLREHSCLKAEHKGWWEMDDDAPEEEWQAALEPLKK